MTAKVLTLGDIGTTWHYSLTARWDCESQREGERERERDDRRQEFCMRSAGKWDKSFLNEELHQLEPPKTNPSPLRRKLGRGNMLMGWLKGAWIDFLPTSWKHNIDVSSPYKVVNASVLASNGLFFFTHLANAKNITVVLESCSWHLVSVSPTFTLLLALCCFQPAPEGN